jgi:long-chain acyl-CoA synthetase
MNPSLQPQAASSVLFARATETPDEIRFIGPDLTLGELAAQVRGVAAWLVGRGVAPGDHVAIWASDRIEWAIAAWAIQACGAAFVSIHAPSSSQQADFILADGDCKLLISDQSHRPDADLLLDGDGWNDAVATAWVSLPEVSADSRACLIYTSGTTGDPKGVVLTHANLWANGLDWLEVVGPLLPPEATEVHWLPMSHIFGWGALCIGTVFGMKTALSSFHDVGETLARVRPHLLCGVPLLWDLLPPEATGGRLCLGLSGAAPLSASTKARYADAGVTLLEGYGLTETSPTLTLERPDQTERDTVGRIYPSVELRIADDGEVLARGPSVFAGYWRREEQPIDADGWFYTGDLGKIDDGVLRLVGRKKELIVLTGGKKVAPNPIESKWPPSAGRLVLVGEGRKHVGALVFDPTNGDPRGQIIRLNRHLSHHEQIRHHVVVTDSPTVENGLLTPSFKLRRHVVAERFARTIDGLYGQELS